MGDYVPEMSGVSKYMQNQHAMMQLWSFRRVVYIVQLHSCYFINNNFQLVSSRYGRTGTWQQPVCQNYKFGPFCFLIFCFSPEFVINLRYLRYNEHLLQESYDCSNCKK